MSSWRLLLRSTGLRQAFGTLSTPQSSLRAWAPLSALLSTTSSSTQSGSPKTSSADSAAKSKAPIFFSPSMQSELKYLTDMDTARVFRVARRGKRHTGFMYTFATEKELGEMREKATATAWKKLQMPPVMDERKPIDHVYEVDTALMGFDRAKYVFTDITFGVHDRERIIVVREHDGTLRKAEWNERDRMNQVYFPKPDRKTHIVPSMFQKDNLEEILGPARYEYILDRTCVQFEPDDPWFVRTCARVFDHIDENEHYEVLRSTRHYGPMVFHLAWEKKCDLLIVHYLSQRDLTKAASTVKVYAMIHSESVSSSVLEKQSASTTELTRAESLELLNAYIDKDSTRSGKLRVALESMLEAEKQKSATIKELEEMHGAK